MKGDNILAVLIGAIAAVITTLILTIGYNDNLQIKVQAEVDKAAITNGLCQIRDYNVRWPGYHWEACKQWRVVEEK